MPPALAACTLGRTPGEGHARSGVELLDGCTTDALRLVHTHARSD